MKSSRNRKASQTSRNILKAAVMATPALLLAVPVTTQAANYWWDTNGSTAGSSGGATAPGIWDGATPNWTTDSGGASATTVWPGTGNVANFAAGTNAIGSYTVTVSGTQNVDGINFEDGTSSTQQITLEGGTLNLTGTPLIIAQGGAVTRTISSVLTGSAGVTWRNTLGNSTAILLTGNNSGLTGQFKVDTLNIGTAATRIQVGNDNALGATGVGNELIFGTSTGGQGYARVELPGNRIIAKDAKIVSAGNFQGGTANIWNIEGTNTWSGGITIDAAALGTGSGANFPALGGSAGTLVVTGVISGTKTWGKNGAAKLVLANTNTFGGNGTFFRIGAGDVEVRANGAFGTASTGNSITNQNVLLNPYTTNPLPGVTFANNVNYTTYELINAQNTFVNATTTQGVGQYVDSINGANTFAGDIRIGELNQGVGFVIGAQAGSSLELSGHLYASSTGITRIITKTGDGELIISGANTTAQGIGTNFNFGLLSGTLDVTGGKLTLRGANGALTGGIGIIGEVGTTITLDSSGPGNANSDRLNDTAPVTLRSAELAVKGNATNGVNEAIGTLTINGGSTITLDNAGQNTQLSPSSLAHDPHGTLLARGLDGTFGNMSGTAALVGTSTTAGAKDLKILPWGIGDTSAASGGSDLLTIGNGTGTGAIRVLAAGEYETTLTQGDTTLKNIHRSANTTFSATVNITQENALKLSGTGTTIDTNIGFLQLQAGTLLATGANEVINGRLRFGLYDLIDNTIESSTVAAEGIIHVSTGANLTINADILTESGIVKAGGGTLVLTNTNNSYVGQTVLNGGILSATVDAFGNSSNAIYLNGGTLQASGSFGLPSSRAVQLQSPVNNVIDVTASNLLTVAGVISGVGPLTKAGTGSLVVTNTNSYTGVTNVNAGDIRVSAGGQLSTTQVRLGGGAVHATADATFTNTLAVNSAAKGIVVDATKNLTWSGTITGASQLVIDGGGTFNPTGNNGHSGGHKVMGGSTIKYTVSQGNGLDPVSTATPYFELDNGTVQVIGQPLGNTGGTNGVSLFGAGKAWKLNAGGGTIDVQQGATTGTPYNLLVSGPISGVGGLTKTGGGAATVVTLAGIQSYTGPTNINQGNAIMFTASRTSSALNVVDGSKMTINANNLGVYQVGALNLNTTGTVDLNDNDLVVNNGNFLTIFGQWANGYSPTPDTTKTGIISTVGQSGAGDKVLTLFNNALVGSPDWPSGSGQTIGANAIVGKFTYAGDADINGMVTPDDYGVIDANLGQTGLDPGIAQLVGDLDYNYDVTPDDYGVIDANLGKGIGNPLAANGLAVVPEPASLGILGVAGAGMLLRRRRSK